ncbi:MAG TPA: type II toxin-antitoxin system VapC family toxin [Vicinamibacteria bacterium]|nr:type II toxin-antitoxin system VapC family toxin [Vicinamibacteria bacterium]
MRLLLDTHTLIWWLTDDKRLLSPERDSISDGETIAHVSAATLWEISIKRNLGRIDVDEEELSARLEEDAFVELSITWRHGRRAGSLPRHHDDPFDRMLIAQAQEEQLILVSYDGTFRDYDVELMPSSGRDTGF